MVSTTKRKHHHVVKTRLTLFHHASVPIRFLSTTFQTATYLINKMPTPVLSYQSPFEKISTNLQIFKNYESLDVCDTLGSASMHLINLIIILVLMCLLVTPLNIMHIVALIPSLKNTLFPIM